MEEEGHQFTCAMCGGTFVASRPNEEALEECKELFGVDPTADNSDCAEVCDDCFQTLQGNFEAERPTFD